MTVGAGDVINASDINSIVDRPRFVGSFSTALTNNTITTMTPASALENVGSMWSSGTDITIAEAGWYNLGIVLRYPSQATAAGVRQARINVNGTEQILFQVPTTTGLNASNIVIGGVIKLLLAATDTVSFAGFQNSGVSQTLIGNSRGWVEKVVQ